MSRTTLNQISKGLPFENNLVANALSLEDKSKLVYDLSQGYNVIDSIITANMTSRRIYGPDGVFQTPIMGASVVQAEVANTVINGSLLRVNFVDTTYDKFRKTEVVTDGSAGQYKGRVVNAGPGYIELEVVPSVTAWSTSTHFVAGSFATVLWNAQANRGSGAMESLYEYPEYVDNHTGIMRDNLALYRRDLSSTWVEFQGKYWYSAQDVKMMERWARKQEFRAIFSEYGQTNSSDGVVNHPMGLFQAIKDSKRGGVYKPLANVPTQGDIESFLNEIADRQNVGNASLTLVVGRGWWNALQGITSDYIKYAGQANTFGGTSVQGLNVDMYAVNGVKANIIHSPFFNDKLRFPGLSSISGSQGYSRLQYTAVAIDLNNYEAVGGGGTLPAMEKVHFGDEEEIYYYVPGIIGSKAKFGDNGELRNGDFNMAVHHNDTVTTGMYTDSAHNFIATNMGLMELAL